MVQVEQNTRVKIIFLLAIITLIVLSVFSYIKYNNIIVSSNWIKHTQDVKIELNKTLSSLQQYESNQRGYILTKDTAFLPSYSEIETKINSHLDTISQLTKDNPAQQKNLTELKTAIFDRIDFMQKVFVDAKTSSVSSQSWLDGKLRMDKVVNQIKVLEDEENRLLQIRSRELNDSAFLPPLLMFVMVMGAIFIAAVAYLKINNLNESLKKSSDRYFSMVDEVQDYAIISLSPTGIVENWNIGAERIKGYKASEIVGKSFYQFFTDEDKKIDLPNKLLAKAIEESKSVHEGWRVRKDGTLFWASVVITAVHNKKNEVVGFSKVTHDLTEKKDIEEKLKKSHALLEEKNTELEKANLELLHQKEFSETILNTAPFIIGACDAELRIIAFNKACEEIYHVKKEDVLGKVYTDVFPFSLNTKSYDDMLRAIHGETIHNATLESVSTGRIFENFLSPLKDETGKVYAVVSIAQDITDMVKANEAIKKANEELSESNERFIKVFDNNPVPMTLTEIKTNKIKYANKVFYKTFGYTAEEVIGRTSEELNLVDPAENQRLIKIIFDLLKETRSLEELKALSVEETEEILLKLKQSDAMKNFEILYTRKNGETFPTEISYEIVRVNSERYTVVSYRDITERKKIQQQLTIQNENLLKANKELESFNYISSHDLQEPLRQIQNFVSRISDMEHQNLSEKGKTYFDKMSNAAKRMQTLITDLLAYSRTKTSERKFKKIDVCELVEEVKGDLSETIEEKKAIVEVTEDCEITVIPFQFRQMLHNLIGNSLKFSKEDVPPHIIITNNIVPASEVPGANPDVKEYYHMSISDNGIGFEPQYKERIFEVFQRLHDRQKIAGTGIGLAIVKKIVENHNGIITATGELNKGATFDVYIPTVQ